MPVISTNNAANAALNYLNLNSSRETEQLAQLASGSRIVQASDDAAGLAIGTQLNAGVTVYTAGFDQRLAGHPDPADGRRRPGADQQRAAAHDGAGHRSGLGPGDQRPAFAGHQHRIFAAEERDHQHRQQHHLCRPDAADRLLPQQGEVPGRHPVVQLHHHLGDHGVRRRPARQQRFDGQHRGDGARGDQRPQLGDQYRHPEPRQDRRLRVAVQLQQPGHRHQHPEHPRPPPRWCSTPTSPRRRPSCRPTTSRPRPRSPP